MKIHSDILTRQDFHLALMNAPRGVDIFELEGPAGSRKRASRFELFLMGNSPYAAQRGPCKAATWDEWGIVLNELFCKDPEMIAGQYDGQESFRRQTLEQRELIETNAYYQDTPHGRKRAKDMKAPWLMPDGSFAVSVSDRHGA